MSETVPFPTQIQASFVGFKESYSFTNGSGENIRAGAKLQLLVDTGRGNAALLDVSEKSWDAAGGPKVAELSRGQEFLIAGAVCIRGRDGWFAADRVEAA
jgi:hypothetical protein